MMIRFLIGWVLAEVAVIGAVLSLAAVLNVWDGLAWRQEAIMANAERNACQVEYNELKEWLINETP
jgi:hypothetical protein